MDTSKYTVINAEIIIQNNMINETSKAIVTKMFQDMLAEYTAKAGLFTNGEAVSISATIWDGKETKPLSLLPDENSFKFGKPTDADEGH